MTLQLDTDRFVATMEEQAAIGATPDDGLHRLALTDADKEIRDWFVDQLTDLNLTVRIDEFGNIFGRRQGTNPDANPVLIGSHLDSQPNGGIYDGQLGVVTALEFLRTLEDEGIETRRPIEIVNWTNEEGSRFQPAMQGSGVWAGAHALEAEYQKTDRAGTAVREELERIGYLGESPAEPTEPYDSYLELHIEQGPRLERAGANVGIVTGIVGFTWGEVTFTGEADHSGPTPMDHRRDALVAAADFITAVRRLPGTLGEATVGTVGAVDVSPNSINVIPNEVTVTWDVRDGDDAVVEQAAQRARQEAAAAATREGVEYEVSDRMRAPSISFADRTVSAVTAAADEMADCRAIELESGAGHDATHLTSVCDTGMVFAVSEDGKSHSPAEYTSWDDCCQAATVFANAALQLATE
ncbi:N-carbamoyl-L-amino acid amidohydrolase [Natrialba hulunbeirensis JCM 10989]|uniref:N-carbamoyl-L-amino acid amidohydrolase n=1 Tax=Natrialba hulunbeirensis JCM 10989 TaxID=1227493 RepID=M0A1R0_9EURY|nr:Zn-dependent hydrolase [Natrialba hulunbeirensis]ELY91782.1 N-carbamoyl-L-amino acid amidohydrolase [Natrialba hulunbeirensis JCM 10989]